MCDSNDLYWELDSAIDSDDFEKFERLVNEKRNIFDTCEDGLLANLVSNAVKKCRNNIFEFLLPLLCPSHLYDPLKYAVKCMCPEHYIYKLIENGAPLDALDGTFFISTYRTNLKMMKLVLGRGFNPNITIRGEVKLLLSYLCEFAHTRNSYNFSNGDDSVECMDETVAMFLYYGADVSFNRTHRPHIHCNGSCYVEYSDALKLVSCATNASDFVFEQIFLYTFDDTKCSQRIYLSTFLEVMNPKNYSGGRKHLIRKLLNYELEFVVDEDEDRKLLFKSFVDMEFNLFEIVARRSPNAICAIFNETEFVIVNRNNNNVLRRKFYNDFLKKMEYLVTKEVFFNHVVDFLENLDVFEVCETEIGIFLFMVQYGIQCDIRMYHAVYKVYGDCLMFRTLLHLDMDEYWLEEENKSVMASFIRDINLCVQTFVDSIPGKYWFLIPHRDKLSTSLRTPYGYLTEDEALNLLDFFVHPKLIDFLLSTENLPNRVFRKIQLLPKVPSLHELARDTLRKHIVDRFHVSTTKQFYSIVNGLRISAEHRKIITFERKLYVGIVLDNDHSDEDENDLSDEDDENPPKRQRR